MYYNKEEENLKIKKSSKICSVNKRKKNKKKVSKYTFSKRFYLLLLVFILILVVIFKSILSKNNNNLKDSSSNIVITQETNVYNLDIKTNGDAIKNTYSTSQNKEYFLKMYNELQNQISMYVINNTTNDINSFKVLVDGLKLDLTNYNFSKLSGFTNSFFAVDYILEDTANLKIKFKSKDIEPTWINDNDISNKIILN